MPSPTNSGAAKKRVGIIGGSGLLGGDLLLYLASHFDVVGIDRENYDTYRGQKFDVVINANGNSRRFWAETHVYEDFEASTISVARSLVDFTYDFYVFISSSDVYNNHTEPLFTHEEKSIEVDTLHPYGFHKFLSEQIVRNRAPKFLILRSSMMLGTHLKKGPFYDILHTNRLFITPDSRLQLITTRAIADIILLLLQRGVTNTILNMGGRGALLFSKAGQYFKEKIEYADDAKKQEYEMDVVKLGTLYPLKTSEEYLQEFLIQ